MLVHLSLLLSLLAQHPTPAQEDDNAHLTRLVRTAGSGVHWISDPFELYDLWGSRSRRQPYSPPIDRNALLDRALAMAKDEHRLVMVYVFRIEGRPMYRAPLLDNYMRLSLFSDPELVALINRKFVPLRLYADKNVAKRLGMFNAKPDDDLYLSVLEPALVFLTPDGKVVHCLQRIRTFSTYWTRHVLKDVLDRNKDYARPSLQTELVAGSDGERDRKALVWLARQQCLDGDETKALATLARSNTQGRDTVTALRKGLAALEAKKPKDEEGREYRIWRRRVRMLEQSIATTLRGSLDYYLTLSQANRLLRRGERALAVLERAKTELGDAAANEPDYWLERARVDFALGNIGDAATALDGAGESSEAEFLRGLADWLVQDREKALPHFRRAVALGETPFNVRAAGILASATDTTPFSPLAHCYEMVPYGPPEAYAVALPTTTELKRTESPARARDGIARAAVEFLLAQQRPDGTWADARYVWAGTDILPNVHIAVTALAASALLAWRDLDPARIDAAVHKAEQCIADDSRLSLGNEEEVYSEAYRMLYWTRKVAGNFGTKAENFANLEALAKRSSAIQNKTTGFFAHEYPNAFCTGAMMWSLYLAKSLGVQIDDDEVQLGVKALLSARRQDGSFSYGGSARQRDGRRPGQDSITHLKNAAARMPVCETVLHAFGSSDPNKVRAAFETFLTYLDRIARVRKTDFHSDGELAGFFFWHAMFHTSEAMALTDVKTRETVSKRLLDLVTSFAEIDGSFVDSHELGKSYGTAMALLVLKHLPGK